MNPFQLVPRTPRALSFLVPLSLAVAGCAGTAPPCETAAALVRPDPPADRREATFRLAYAITRTDPEGTVLVAGKTDVDRAHSSRIEESAPRDASHSLSIDVEPRSDGRLAVAVEWREVSGEGRVVSWRPSLALAPDVAGVVSLDLGDGDGRRLVVTATPLGEVATAAPEPLLGADRAPLSSTR